MTVDIPDPSLVVLIGPAGAGKSTFARAHFRPTEVLSSDAFRGMLADDETDQTATPDAFAVLHIVAGKRLARGRLTVVDATNVRPEARRQLLGLARRYDRPAVAVVLDVHPDVCDARNRARPDRQFGPHVVRRHAEDLRWSLPHLGDEGFWRWWVLAGPEEVSAATVNRVRLEAGGGRGLLSGGRGPPESGARAPRSADHAPGSPGTPPPPAAGAVQ